MSNFIIVIEPMKLLLELLKFHNLNLEFKIAGLSNLNHSHKINVADRKVEAFFFSSGKSVEKCFKRL